MTTLGAPAGAVTSNRAGAFTLRASSSVNVGRSGWAIGRTVRSIVPGGAEDVAVGGAGADVSAPQPTRPASTRGKAMVRRR